MTSKPFRICLVAALACGAAAFGVHPAGAASGTTTYHAVLDVRVPMSDGATISLNEFIPDSTCPCPVVLTQTPYRKGTSTTDTNDFLPSHGYVHIVSDVRGTGDSEGYWDVFGPREQLDGAELVRWAAKQPWSDGKIATYGGSYLGINQFLTAEQPGTEALKAMFPIIPMSDSYRDVTWSGGAFDSAFMPWWYALVNGENSVPPSDLQSDPQVALNAESQHLLDVYQYTAQVGAASITGSYQAQYCAIAGPSAPTCQYTDASYDSDMYRLRSPIVNVSKVHIPTFIVGGEWDIFQRGEPLLYRALDLPTTQKKLILGPWYHVTAGNGLPAKDTTGRTIPAVDDLALAWFDHWLKGVDNGVENFPTVETWEQGTNAWLPNTSFPAAGTQHESWYLTPDASGSGANSLQDASLSTSAPGPAGTLTLPWLPLNGLCSRSTSQWLAGLDEEAGTSPPCDTNNALNEIQALTFTTPAFKDPYLLSGPLDLHLFLSSTQTDSSLAAFVTDVAPDGTSTYVTSGALVASLRALTPTACGAVVEGCSVYADGQIVEPWHPYTLASQQPLPAGKPAELQIEIFPTTAVFQAGHRLRLVIASGDAPHRFDTLSTLTGEVAGVNTVYTGGSTPSRLYAGFVAAAPQTQVQGVTTGSSSGSSGGSGSGGSGASGAGGVQGANAGRGQGLATTGWFPLSLFGLALGLLLMGAGAAAMRRRAQGTDP